MKILRRFHPSTSFLLGIGTVALLPHTWFMALDYYYQQLTHDDVFDLKEH